ncbi:ankyrin repeat domain-containing protein [Ottowia thiooxydans]|uniref:Ankyrin repeat protein n=1 Tax=Ottowia thiooxydans TaxID=219182 RepID=A0ABV2QFV9_9BURK
MLATHRTLERTSPVNFGSPHPGGLQSQLHFHGLVATPPQAAAPDVRRIQISDGADRETLLNGLQLIPDVRVLTAVERIRFAVERNDVLSLRELSASDPNGFFESIHDGDEVFLVRASELGHVEMLRFLLDCDVEPSMQDAAGRTALMFAAQHDHAGLGMMEMLLSCGANPDIQDDEDRTALLIAVGRQNLPMVKCLVEAKADIQLRDARNWSPLMHALSARSERRTAIAEFLLDQWRQYEREIHEPLPLGPEYETYTTALLDALDAGVDLEMFDLLLRRGADVNQAGGNTDWIRLPLISAISARRIDLAVRMLEVGADFRARDSERYNALMIVVSDQLAQRAKLLESFLRSSLVPDQRFMVNWSVQNEALSRPYRQMLELMLDEVTDHIDAQADDGRTALMDVIMAGADLAIVKRLLNLGARADLRDDDGWNALMFAVLRKRDDVVNHLMQGLPNVNAQDDRGRTALMDVIEADGELAIIKWLLERGGDVRLRDLGGWNALMYAFSMKRDALDLVLRAVTDLNVRDESGLTVLDDMIRAVGSENALLELLAKSSSFRIVYVDSAPILFDTGSMDPNRLPSPTGAPWPNGSYAPQWLAENHDRQDASYIQEKILRDMEGGATVQALQAVRECYPDHFSEVMTIHGESFLVAAAEHGHVSRVKFLLESGVNRDAQDSSGRSALFLAVWKREPEIARQLLAAGANIFLRAHDGRSALMMAVVQQRSERFELMQRLLPTDLDLRTLDGWSALTSKLASLGSGLLECMLNQITDVDEQDAQGCTALIHVIAAGADLATVSSLLIRGANIQLRDHHGWNAFMHAASSNAPEEVLEFLVFHLDRQTELIRDLQQLAADMTELVKLKSAQHGQGGVKRRLQELESDRADLENARAQRTQAVDENELVALESGQDTRTQWDPALQ